MLGLTFVVLSVAYAQLAACMSEDLASASNVSDFEAGDDWWVGDEHVVLDANKEVANNSGAGQDYFNHLGRPRPRTPLQTYFVIRVDLFVLPEHFGKSFGELLHNWEILSLKFLNDWVNDLKNVGITIQLRPRLMQLNKDDIWYGHNQILYSDDLFRAMRNSKTIKDSPGPVKMLLLPYGRHQKIYTSSGGVRILGVAQSWSHGDITEKEHYGIANIMTLEGLMSIRNNPTDQWTINKVKQEYRNMKNMNKVGVVAHELGHILGANECPDKDDYSVMCRPGVATGYGYYAREQIKCRLQQTLDTSYCKRMSSYYSN